MKFWDSSAVIPLIWPEEASRAREQQLAEDAVMVVWWGTSVECVSAVQRLARTGAVAPEEVDRALGRLEELEKHWTEVEPSQQVRRQAARLLRIHPLRAADALQLAAAVIAAEHEPEGLGLLSADARLVEAARKEGFKVG